MENDNWQIRQVQEGQHPGGGQRVTVYSSTSLCLPHKAQNHRPVSTLELSIAEYLTRVSLQHRGQELSLSRNQAQWSSLMGTPGVPMLSSAWKNDIHGPYLPTRASFHQGRECHRGTRESFLSYLLFMPGVLWVPMDVLE